MPTRSYEASVLFQIPVSYGSGDMEEDLALLAEAHDAHLREVETNDKRFRLFDFGLLQILIATGRTPLDPAHFLDSSRPAGATLSDTEILSRLTAHRYSMTVLVADHPDCLLPDNHDRDALRHRICWQIVESLRGEDGATLVFWCDNDTLYGSEEFGVADIYGSGATLGDTEAEPGGGHILDIKKMVEAKAMTFMQTQIIQGAHRSDAEAQPQKSDELSWIQSITQPISRLLRRKAA
ncbi:MAG: hypothetical protein AAF626_16330 [Pseudomonadota bacterium]